MATLLLTCLNGARIYQVTLQRDDVATDTQESQRQSSPTGSVAPNRPTSRANPHVDCGMHGTLSGGRQRRPVAHGVSYDTTDTDCCTVLPLKPQTDRGFGGTDVQYCAEIFANFHPKVSAGVSTDDRGVELVDEVLEASPIPVRKHRLRSSGGPGSVAGRVGGGDRC